MVTDIAFSIITEEKPNIQVGDIWFSRDSSKIILIKKEALVTSFGIRLVSGDHHNTVVDAYNELLRVQEKHAMVFKDYTPDETWFSDGRFLLGSTGPNDLYYKVIIHTSKLILKW